MTGFQCTANVRFYLNCLLKGGKNKINQRQKNFDGQKEREKEREREREREREKERGVRVSEREIDRVQIKRDRERGGK